MMPIPIAISSAFGAGGTVPPTSHCYNLFTPVLFYMFLAPYPVTLLFFSYFGFFLILFLVFTYI